MMIREFNTSLVGKSFDQAIIDKVWAKGIKVEGVNPDHVRRDICKTSIAKNDYGKQEKYGWEIDHIKPISKGGTDDIGNLQPLFWKNNREKSDNYPWKCLDRK